MIDTSLDLKEKLMSVDKRNYVLVLDRSGSMSSSVKPNSKKTRWEAVQETTFALAKFCEKFDSDGIDIYLFNTSFRLFANTTADKVKEIFDNSSPNGGTDFIPVLTYVIESHFKTSDKPTTIFVITDGCPSDGKDGENALAELLINTANKLENDNDLAISFLQIGNDFEASHFLKNLDDNLQNYGAKFDIVDTKTFDEIADKELVDILLDAIKD